MESVADPDDELSVGNELFEIIGEPGLHAIGKNRSRTQVVSEGEPADECENMKFVQIPFAGEKIVQMHFFRGCAAALKRRRGFFFAVQTDTGDDQNLYL